jgi:hypothetical protein
MSAKWKFFIVYIFNHGQNTVPLPIEHKHDLPSVHVNMSVYSYESWLSIKPQTDSSFIFDNENNSALLAGTRPRSTRISNAFCQHFYWVTHAWHTIKRFQKILRFNQQSSHWKFDFFPLQDGLAWFRILPGAADSRPAAAPHRPRMVAERVRSISCMISCSHALKPHFPHRT